MSINAIINNSLIMKQLTTSINNDNTQLLTLNNNVVSNTSNISSLSVLVNDNTTNINVMNSSLNGVIFNTSRFMGNYYILLSLYYNDSVINSPHNLSTIFNNTTLKNNYICKLKLNLYNNSGSSIIIDAPLITLNGNTAKYLSGLTIPNLGNYCIDTLVNAGSMISGNNTINFNLSYSPPVSLNILNYSIEIGTNLIKS